MKTKTKIWLLTAAALVGVFAVLAGIKAGQIGSMIKAGKAFVPPPESVTSAKVERAEWAGSTSAVGTLVALRGVVVGAELAGTIRQIGFDSGQTVKKGAVLVKLDTSTEEAQLASAKADRVLARLTLQRTRSLRQNGVTTAAELEGAEARAAQADAAVEALEASISKKTIRAPFEGRVAIRQVELGQVLSAGAPVASMHTVTPMYAEFSLPQQALASVAVGQRVHVRADIFPRDQWDGEVSTINTEVDPTTRNIRIRATVANPDGRLRPGMYVSVEVLSSGSRPVNIIPATSVLFAPYGDSVFVIEPKKREGSAENGAKTAPATSGTARADDAAAGKKTETASGPPKPGANGAQPDLVVRQKFVRLGERRGDFVEVQSGLDPGEVIVSSGAFKLRNGMAVTVNNALAPQAELNPRPTD